jgi:hypothetical protein
LPLDPSSAAFLGTCTACARCKEGVRRGRSGEGSGRSAHATVRVPSCLHHRRVLHRLGVEVCEDDRACTRCVRVGISTCAVRSVSRVSAPCPCPCSCVSASNLHSGPTLHRLLTTSQRHETHTQGVKLTHTGWEGGGGRKGIHLLRCCHPLLVLASDIILVFPLADGLVRSLGAAC